MEKRLKEGQKEILTHILNRMPKGEFILTTSFMEPSWMRILQIMAVHVSLEWILSLLLILFRLPFYRTNIKQLSVFYQGPKFYSSLFITTTVNFRYFVLPLSVELFSPCNFTFTTVYAYFNTLIK